MEILYWFLKKTQPGQPGARPVCLDQQSEAITKGKFIQLKTYVLAKVSELRNVADSKSDSIPFYLNY